MRLLATIAALLALACCVAPTRAGTGRLSQRDAEMYLRGYIDGSTPSGWHTVSTTCARTSHGFACQAEADQASHRVCWLVSLSRDGWIDHPFQQIACKSRRGGPAA